MAEIDVLESSKFSLFIGLSDLGIVSFGLSWWRSVHLSLFIFLRIGICIGFIVFACSPFISFCLFFFLSVLDICAGMVMIDISMKFFSSLLILDVCAGFMMVDISIYFLLSMFVSD